MDEAFFAGKERRYLGLFRFQPYTRVAPPFLQKRWSTSRFLIGFNKPNCEKMATFIDLFAGLGGFHKALSELGHRCVFASEIDPGLRELYSSNWNLRPSGDLRQLIKKDISEIPDHEILCAGFPCQPFSKAGKQLGRDDENRGTLFDEIIKILKAKRPRYFILENVPFIAKHDNEKTWRYMENELTDLGYEVDHRNYSPHQFGIPQHRIRIFIVGSNTGLAHFDFGVVDSHKRPLAPVLDFLDKTPALGKSIPNKNKETIQLWQRFLDSVPKEVQLPGHPIWAAEFGATYPFEAESPKQISAATLSKFKGSFGQSLSGLRKAEQLKLLPSYARGERRFPEWKRRFVRLNRQFYNEHKMHIADIVKEIAQLEYQSWQKLEWNVDDGPRNISEYILQFRASGLRVKKRDFFPSLVCTNSQVPIVGWQDRYITGSEGLRLQGLDGLTLPENDNAAFRALGNAVNAQIVRLVADELLIFEEEKIGVAA